MKLNSAEAKKKNRKLVAYEFGSFRLLADEKMLFRDDKVLPLTPKLLELLIYFVQRPGALIRKDDLMESLWPDSFVEESNINVQISYLRRMLGENAFSPRFISTVPRQGYRFAAEPHVFEYEGPYDSNSTKSTKSRSNYLAANSLSLTAAPLRQDLQTLSTNQSNSKAVHDEPILESAISTPISRNPAWSRKMLLSFVAFFLVVGAAFVLYPTESTPRNADSSQLSIAILPFKPMLQEERNESLEIGMTNELISKLSKLHFINVRSFEAVMRHAGDSKDALSVGREMKVDLVLDGHVQRVGKNLRASVRLFNVSNGETLLAESFFDRFENIFAIQSEISIQIAQSLSSELTKNERDRIAKYNTENLEAYELYYKGMSIANHFSKKVKLDSVDYFNAAIDKDPAYILPYVGLAIVYQRLAEQATSSEESLEYGQKCKSAALQAFELNNDSAATNSAMAWAVMTIEMDWQKSEFYIKRALEINPKDTFSLAVYSTLLTILGRHDEALETRRLIERLDPTSSDAVAGTIFTLYSAHRYDEALSEIGRFELLSGPSWGIKFEIARAHMGKGMYLEAIKDFNELKGISEKITGVLPLLSYTYAVSGKRSEAEAALMEMRSRGDRNKLYYTEACVYAALGEKDKAFEHLDQAFGKRKTSLIWLKSDNRLDNLHNDPRWNELLIRMGLSG